MADARLFTVGSFVAAMTVQLPRMPHPGETLPASLFDFGPGGKGSNQAIGARRLGADVFCLTRVGTDAFANLASETYRQERLPEAGLLRTDGHQTGVALIYVDAAGENTIGLYPGANDRLSAEDVRGHSAELTRSHLVAAQLEVPDAPIAEAFRLARAQEIPTLLNPAPARQLPNDLLALVDTLTPNAVEAQMLLDQTPREPLDDTDAVALARALRDRGPAQVVITRGARGAVAVGPDNEPLFQSAPSVETVDTVGAGDAFNAGLAVSLAEGQPLARAVALACRAGALATTRLGVIDALPDRAAVSA